MRKITYLLLIRCIFTVVFVYASLSKLLGLSLFILALKEAVGNPGLAKTLAWLIPIAELAAVVLLVQPRTARAGFYSCLGLMTAFTFYIILMMVFARHLPCSCGGIISGLSWPQHLFFNLFLILLSIAGVWLTNNMDHPKHIDGQHGV